MEDALIIKSHDHLNLLPTPQSETVTKYISMCACGIACTKLQDIWDNLILRNSLSMDLNWISLNKYIFKPKR